MKSERGNAYIEYFMAATVVMLATIAFFNNGQFQGARASVEQATTAAMNRIAGQ